MLTGLMAGAGVAMLAGCDRMTQSTQFGALLRNTEKLTMSSQRLLLGRQPLAREYSVADLSPVFRANGTQSPNSDEYAHLLEHGFVDWRLQVDGLVQQPLSLSLADLKRLPSRTQITRHDCVEGWSAIGQWQGVHLGRILDIARLKPGARYVVFHCADELEKTFDGSGRYAMNGKNLPVAHGAPLRLRVERQLGYKHAKYLMRIEVVSAFDTLWGGRGGYWEDRGYEWYAGI
jgi:DMSO/TMAO reductase YedYZ molybdopterin-dependent catalytic subunit